MKSKIDLAEIGYEDPGRYIYSFFEFKRHYGEVLAEVVLCFKVPIYYKDQRIIIRYAETPQIHSSILNFDDNE